MSQTEPWRYSEQTLRIVTRFIRLRYELQPYILDCARRVSEEGYTMMRPLVFDFADDRDALAQDCEYMFGPELLICPVTETGVSTVRVYLPENKGGWKDYWTDAVYDGGQYLDVPLSIETIPVFRRL